MSIESEPKHCPKCGEPIPAEAPQGLCPKCLFEQAGMATEAGPGAPGKSSPPTIDELSAAFPQLQILELIGQGGMGFVFKARQPKLDRYVALKILPQSLAVDPAFAERFSREGCVLARLNHPNIVTVHDFGEAGGFFYLLMEFVDGVNLRQAMRVGRFTPAQALAIVPKICEALQFAHHEGILHRDIKPENILLDSKGRVKIADFGIAKLVGAEPLNRPSDTLSPSGGQRGGPPPAALTQTGKALGTPLYMAPEQLEHPQDVDHRADIYSLGVVFYEMLTGELPLGRFAPPSVKSTVDPRVDEVVLRTLEKERERRTQSAEEVRTQVETIAATPSGSRRREEAPSGKSEIRNPKSESEPRFSRTAIVGICWSVFAFLATLFWFVASKEGGPGQTPTTLGRLLAVTLVPLGITAPFGATILGWIAVSQIRRSAGRLHGLWLAVFDGLFFPFLVLDGVLVLAWVMVSRVFVGFYANPAVQNRPDVVPSLVTKLANHFSIHPVIPFFAAAVTILIVDYFLIRYVWRAVNRPLVAADRSASVPAVSAPARASGSGWKIAAAIVAGVMLVLAIPAGFILFTYPTARPRVLTPAPQIAVFESDVSFGPVIERVLDDIANYQGNEALQLSSGEVRSLPASARPYDSRHEWMESNQTDLLLDFAAHQRIMTRKGVRLADFSGDRWAIATPGAIRQALEFEAAGLGHDASSGAGTYWMNRTPKFPVTLAFETGEGLRGLLQITGFSDNPPGVKIRYKTVQDKNPNGTITSVRTDGQKATVTARLGDGQELLVFVGQEKLGWSVGGIPRAASMSETIIETVESSSQMRLEDGSFGKGLVLRTVLRTGTDTAYVAITPDGPVPYGEVVFRDNPAITVADGVFTFADIRQPDGTLVPVSARVRAALPEVPEVRAFASNLDMRLVPIPPGTFTMGSSDRDPGPAGSKPLTRVTISRPFFLGATEVTQAQWKKVMGSNPSVRALGYLTEQERVQWAEMAATNHQGDALPVVEVSWDDAMTFCVKLTEQERAAGRLPAGWEFTLPTEAQWEYACRAGTTGDHAGDLGAVAWYALNSQGKTHPVGTKKPNAWGLSDMYGNVWEWCYDWYGVYPGGAKTDPTGATSGTERVTRGGGFGAGADGCASANRNLNLSGFRNVDTGFRLALVVATASGPEAKASANAPPAAGPGFGPVIERVLNDQGDRMGSDVLRLEDGKLFNLPKGLDFAWRTNADPKQMPHDDQQHWLDDTRVNFAVSSGDVDQWDIVTRKAKIAMLPDARWETMPAADLRQRLPGLTWKTPKELYRNPADPSNEFAVLALPTGTIPPVTFAFETGDGDFGLLQIVSFGAWNAEKAREVKIRYKLVQDGPIKTSAAGTGFGPVIERVVQQGMLALGTAQLTNCWINFETGDLISLTDKDDRTPFVELEARLRQQGVDATCAAGARGPMLKSFDEQLRFVYLPGQDEAEIAAGDVPRLWNRHTPKESTEDLGEVRFPQNYIFKSREGNFVFLQLTGLSENPIGVKIRYKMVQNQDSK
jgi:serine/threonine protein kinase/formylglycine-generating enzyme required for sulfatase activity